MKQEVKRIVAYRSVEGGELAGVEPKEEHE